MRTVLRLITLVVSLVAMTQAGAQVLRLSTTTSTEQSGLLAALLPQFKADTGIDVRVIAVGSGKALELARNGDVDVTLVHAREAEEQFMAAGHGKERRPVMHNDFILVGPPDDPAGVQGINDVVEALRRIVRSSVRFISRGDDSGTHKAEQAFWELAGLKPAGRAYVSAGQGMGKVLLMASELGAYTLTDRATFASYAARQNLEIMVEGDPRMFNPYSVITVNPGRHTHVNYHAALAFADWITSAAGRQRIARFRIGGQQMFFPASHE